MRARRRCQIHYSIIPAVLEQASRWGASIRSYLLVRQPNAADVRPVHPRAKALVGILTGTPATMRGKDLAGGLLSIVSSIISNFGVNLQKVVHNENEARPEDEQVAFTSVPRWWQAGRSDFRRDRDSSRWGSRKHLRGARRRHHAVGKRCHCPLLAQGGTESMGHVRRAWHRDWRRHDRFRDTRGQRVHRQKLTGEGGIHSVQDVLRVPRAHGVCPACQCRLVFLLPCPRRHHLGINRPLVRTIDAMKGLNMKCCCDCRSAKRC